jgi:hypothetical protein
MKVQDQHQNKPKTQSCQTSVMHRFFSEFPNGSFEDYKKYYENYINEKFDKYKQKQLKLLNKNLK